MLKLIARNLAQEAKMTADLGCVGDDAYGRRLTEVCQQEGVVTRLVMGFGTEGGTEERGKAQRCGMRN